MAMQCHNATACDGCYGCVPDLPVCCICGRTIGPYDDAIKTERGMICDDTDCRFEAAMAASDEDDLYDFAENEKESYIKFIFWQEWGQWQ